MQFRNLVHARIGDARTSHPQLLELFELRECCQTFVTEIGLWQISEIMEAPELDLAGPLPAEIQNYTAYEAAVVQNGAANTAALQFRDYLESPPARSALAQSGMV